MAGPVVLISPVPDVGVGDGPFPSPAWIVGPFGDLDRLGSQVAATDADVVVLLGAAVNTDPIDETNKNVLGTFVGGGMKAAELLHASACAFYAFLRYPPSNGGTPTVGLTFEMLGT